MTASRSCQSNEVLCFVPQVRHVLGEPVLAALPARSAALACAGNALLVPRALALGNGMFLTAVTWGASMGWITLACLIRARWSEVQPPALIAFVAMTATLGLGGRAVLRWHRAARAAEQQVHKGYSQKPWFVMPPSLAGFIKQQGLIA